MPDMRKDYERWNAMTVAERREAIDKRRILPALKVMHEDFEKKRREGRMPRYDMVPHFVDSYRAMREQSRQGSDEERGLSRACMKVVESSARQQLSRADFARFKEGIK